MWRWRGATDFDEECDDALRTQPAAIPTCVWWLYVELQARRALRRRHHEWREACDDGVNDGQLRTCKSDCSLAPRCGDGNIDRTTGRMRTHHVERSQLHRRVPSAGGCGDGLIEPPEECDDGSLNNNGEYGGCAPSCVFAPHCGDGIVNETRSATTARTTAHTVAALRNASWAPLWRWLSQRPEECDSGSKNGVDGICTSSCKKIIYVQQ